MEARVRERGIIFNSEMVNAVLSGRKTQTRQIFDWKKQPAMEMAERDDGSLWPWAEDCENGGDIWFPCPFGAVGDRLWVRETFGFEIRSVGGSPHEQIVYRASKPDAVRLYDCNGKPYPMKWTPSIHMPRSASRITLEITGVRVERLNDIDQAGALAEGITDGHGVGMEVYNFSRLWRDIYGEERWQSNPWVWCISFRRIE